MVAVHAVDYTEYTTYSFTIKYFYVRLMLLIAVKNGLGIMAVDIGNALCMALCAKNIWSCCGAEFGPRCGTVKVLNQAFLDQIQHKTHSQIFWSLFKRPMIYTIHIRSIPFYYQI